MLSKTKKALILAGMLVLLVVTGYLNIVLNSAAGDDTTDVGANNQVTFFDGHRMDRQTARDQSLLVLNAIIANPDSTDEAKANAEAEKLMIVQAIQKELALESLIKSKGFEDVVVTTTTENLNVIVKSDEALTTAEVAQILDIIVSETGTSPLNIRIIPV